MLVLPAILRVARIQFQLANQTASGGQSMTGFQQVLASPRARWTAKFTMDVWEEEEILAFRAFMAELDGRANECLVPPRDGIRPRDASGHMLRQVATASWGNGVDWFNGAGWDLPGQVYAQAAAPAAQGATTLTISVLNGEGPRPGHYVGLVDRLYLVRRIAPSSSVAGAVDLAISPRLRAAAAGGDVVTLDTPACRMRLKDDTSGALEQAWRQASSPVIDFVESWPTPVTTTAGS